MAPLGRPAIYFHRNARNVQIQTLRFACTFGVVVATTLVVVNMNGPVPPENGLPNLLKLSSSKFKTSGTPANVIDIQGTSDSLKDISLQEIINKESVTELNVKHGQFNPTIFTESLKDFHNLRKINLTAVKVISTEPEWNFTRVYLPQLKEFVIDLNLGFREQFTEYSNDLTKEKLSKILFYDKTSQNPTDLIQKLTTDGVNITVRVDGWRALSIAVQTDKSNLDARPEAKLILAVSFSDELLQKFNETYKVVHLTMTECSVSKSSFPVHLRYLNLYRATITDGNIMEVLKPMTELTDLYVELQNTSMTISSIPKSVKTLAISDINALYTPGEISEVETVGLGFPIDFEIVSNFDKIFVKVKNVGIFEPSNGTQHLLLQNALKSNAEWIFVEGFERVGSYNGTVTPLETDIEMFLKQLGVLRDDKRFLLVRDNPLAEWRQQKFTKHLILAYRYNLLGWDQYITWEVYANFFVKKI